MHGLGSDDGHRDGPRNVVIFNGRTRLLLPEDLINFDNIIGLNVGHRLVLNMIHF
jgi:hypothetical protein